MKFDTRLLFARLLLGAVVALVLAVGVGRAQDAPQANEQQGINELARGHKELQYAVWTLAERVTWVWEQFLLHEAQCGASPAMAAQVSDLEKAMQALNAQAHAVSH